MKRRYAVIGLALVVGLSTISPALGGPSPVAEVAGGVKKLAKKALGKSKKANKRARRAKRLAKQNAKLIAQMEATPGPQGPRGPAGEDATTLFAYIRDNGKDNEADVRYGSGVTDVVDPSGEGGETYLVTFDRDLIECVVHATTGVGFPSGQGTSVEPNSFPYVNVDPDGEVRVRIYRTSGEATDSSFLLSAFC